MSTGNLVKWYPPISEHPTTEEIALHTRLLYNAVNDHDQAITLLDGKVGTTTASIQAVTQVVNTQTLEGVTAFNSQTGAIIYFPGLGTVNDQLGEPTYTTQQSDNGAKIIVGDSSATMVTLNNLVKAPWFTIIDNDSLAVANLTPSGGAQIFGDSSIYANCFGIVYYDGTNFWSGSTPIGTDSSLGIVRPDGVTIEIDSGGVLFVPIATDSSLGIVEPDGTTIQIGSGGVISAISAMSFTGSLSGDVTGTQSATNVVKVNGAAVPTSAAVVASNVSAQLVAAPTTGSGNVVLSIEPILTNSLAIEGNSLASNLQIHNTGSGSEAWEISVPSGTNEMEFSDTVNSVTPLILTDSSATVFGFLQVEGVIEINSTQSSVSGSIGGSAEFSEPFQGPTYKKVVINLIALSGTASYNFPAAFTETPDYFIGIAATGATVTALSTTAVTVSGLPSTGVIILEGY